MSERSFSEKYLYHFTSPQNIGELPDANGIGEVLHEGGGCLDRVRMAVKVEKGIITGIKYKLRACSGTIAASSAVSTLAVGKTTEDADKIDFDLINDELGMVPERKNHSIELAVKALKSALADYRHRSDE